MLGRNVVCPGGNTQPRGRGYGKGSYREKEEQIM